MPNDTTPTPTGADALRAALASTAQPAAPAAVSGHEVLCWVPEDELPESITSDAYNTLFQHSRVDGIRWFPVFGQSAQTTQPAPAAQGDALDAQRYRELRRGQRWSVVDGIGDTLRGDALDAAIDAACASSSPACTRFYRGKP